MFLTHSKSIVGLGIIALLVISFWGLYSMPINEQGEMSNCPFLNESATVCPMSTADHIAKWQQLFTVTPEKNLLLLSLALLVLMLVALFPFISKVRNKLPYQRFRNYIYKHKPEIKLFDHLLIAFSQGILNPRLYA